MVETSSSCPYLTHLDLLELEPCLPSRLIPDVEYVYVIPPSRDSQERTGILVHYLGTAEIQALGGPVRVFVVANHIDIDMGDGESKQLIPGDLAYCNTRYGGWMEVPQSSIVYTGEGLLVVSKGKVCSLPDV